MAKQRKSWDEMSIKVRKEDNKVIVETLLQLLDNATESTLFRRPLEFKEQGYIRTWRELERVGDDVALVKKGEIEFEPIKYTTEAGSILLRCLFSLPYIQEVRFTSNGDFDVIIYPPFDLRNEIIAGLVISEIKASVSRSVGKKLKEVDDLFANELFA